MFGFLLLLVSIWNWGLCIKKPNQLLQNFSQLSISFWAPEKGVYA